MDFVQPNTGGTDVPVPALVVVVCLPAPILGVQACSPRRLLVVTVLRTEHNVLSSGLTAAVGTQSPFPSLSLKCRLLV